MYHNRDGLYTDNGAIGMSPPQHFLLLSLGATGRVKGWFSAVSRSSCYTFLATSLDADSPGDRRLLASTSSSKPFGGFSRFNSLNFPIIELSLFIWLPSLFSPTFFPGKPGSCASLFVILYPLAISLLFSLRQPVFLSRNLIAALWSLPAHPDYRAVSQQQGCVGLLLR